MKGCASLSIGAFCAVAALAAEPPVLIEQGKLTGVPGRDHLVRVYKGVPFAAPPVGLLRWKPPVPAAPWKGVRTAGDFGAACPQTPFPEASVYHFPLGTTSEDCLYLNVWTAARSAREKRAVMVWLHGGALTRGTGAAPLFDGEALARKGVVLVTINYRLGVLGFLAHPELTKESPHATSGNYGLLDQIAALQWVRRNIASFGGDPNRVTLFGESAGSWGVNCLMASPLAKDLFHRAIGESGGLFGQMRSLREVEQVGVKFARSAGAASLEALRAMPVGDLMKAAADAVFPLNVDGWILPTDIYAIFAAGKQNDVPLLVGFNSDEATSASPWPAGKTAAEFADDLRRRFGRNAERALSVYAASTDDDAREQHYASFRDFTFAWHMRTWARMQARAGKSKAYFYYFSHAPPGAGSAQYGAYHTAEIAYVFQTLRPPRPWQDADRKLADAMSSYWVSFANTGKPEVKRLPRWSAYDPASDTCVEFGDGVRVISHVHQRSLDFLDDHFASLRANGGQNQ